jgi:hypothetical protein
VISAIWQLLVWLLRSGNYLWDLCDLAIISVISAGRQVFVWLVQSDNICEINQHRLNTCSYGQRYVKLFGVTIPIPLQLLGERRPECVSFLGSKFQLTLAWNFCFLKLINCRQASKIFAGQRYCGEIGTNSSVRCSKPMPVIAETFLMNRYRHDLPSSCWRHCNCYGQHWY